MIVNSQVVQVGIALAQALALIMSSAFVLYVAIIIWPFLRHRPAPPGDGSAFRWHIFVPALNEELVIGDTVDYLRATFPATHIWLIDDASDDATGGDRPGHGVERPARAPGLALLTGGADRQGRRAQLGLRGAERVAAG